MAVPTTTAINTAIETWRDTTIGASGGAIVANTPVFNQIAKAVTDPTYGLEAMIDPLITDVSEAKASGTLTSTGNYADGNTVVIGLLAGGSKTYTFQATLTNVDGHVKVGTTEAASIANLHHAINGTGGTAGTDYAAATTAHPDVLATDDGTHVMTLTAAAAGSAWNALVTTTTSSATWGAATMTGGSGVEAVATLVAVDAWRDTLRGPPVSSDDASGAQLDTSVSSLKTTLEALFT
jgi:hypothetical protein